MSWFRDILGGARPEEVRLSKAEDAAFEHARDMVLDRAQLATVDHRGKRLNERKWREHMDFIGSL